MISIHTELVSVSLIVALVDLLHLLNTILCIIFRDNLFLALTDLNVENLLRGSVDSDRTSPNVLGQHCVKKEHFIWTKHEGGGFFFQPTGEIFDSHPLGCPFFFLFASATQPAQADNARTNRR